MVFLESNIKIHMTKDFLEFLHVSMSDANCLGPYIFAGQPNEERQEDSKLQAKL